MALFAITYDLNNQKDYQSLWDEMKRLGAHKAAFSFYFLEANNTAAQVRDHLSELIDDDDRIVVVEFHKRPAHRMAFVGTNDWIREHVG